MEPLNLMVTRNLVADDMRHEIDGRGATAGRHHRAAKKQRSAWSALWRKVISRERGRAMHPSRVTVLR